MTDLQPLVTIGVPVYNGERFLTAALTSLLEQDYPRFEIVISDNASDDGTARICRAFAERDQRIVYVRNAENIGALRNFAAVLHLARGKYFLWAADDDTRNSQYVSRLAEQLEAAPAAVLATPAVIQIDAAGHYIHEPIDRPALPGRTLNNLRRYFGDRAVGWYYGLWRTEFLQPRMIEVQGWPTWGADEIFLAKVALNYEMAGDERAILYRRKKPNSLAPRTARAKLHSLCYMTYYMTQVCLQHDGTRQQRTAALLVAWRYIYRSWIRRSSLLSTLWYHARLLVAAAVTSIWAGLKMPFVRPAATSVPTAAEVEAANSLGKRKRAA